MTYHAIGHRLPAPISNRLFGDRERFGKSPQLDDPSWQEWLRRDFEFYLANQRGTIGATVNSAGYKILSRCRMRDCEILEIGPGAIDHLRYWSGRPKRWTNYDIRPDMLEAAGRVIDATGVEHREVLAKKDELALPFADASFDTVVTFYALEHIYPLDDHLAEIRRVLRPGGQIVGAIPCEGGLAWGTGRMLTSRRWLRKHTTIDPDRLICWEHPNFADYILNRLGVMFMQQTVSFWPLVVPSVDLNLVASFIFEKRAA